MKTSNNDKVLCGQKEKHAIHPVREYNQDLERKAGLIVYEALGQKQTSILFNDTDNC